MRKFLFLVFGIGFWVSGVPTAQAQELRATLTVNSLRATSTDQQVIKNMENAMREFLNNQRWTSDLYDDKERIKCNFQVTIQSEGEVPNSFFTELTIQATRPVYGSAEETLIFQFVDRSFNFSYQFQPLIFNEVNNVSDNMVATLAYYSYIILGLDYDSFSPQGGEAHFRTAMDIKNRFADREGWGKADIGSRDRAAVIENILSPRMSAMRQGWYTYHRQGLDMASTDINKSRINLVNALEKINQAANEMPNSVFTTVFVTCKDDEIIEIFKRGTLAEQDRVLQVMSRIDPGNLSKYRSIK